MPARKPRPQDRTTPANATDRNLWALFADADAQSMANWDFHSDNLVGLVQEAMHLTGALRFSAKRDGTGMGIAVLIEGAVLTSKWSDNVFDLNEWMEDTVGKLRRARAQRDQADAPKAE